MRRLNTKRLKQFATSTAGLITLSVVVLCLAGSSYAFFLGGGNGPAASSGSVNLSKGLVGWWKLDNNTKDSTVYGEDGTPTSVTPVADREGRFNSAYSFNGSSSVITASGTFGGLTLNGKRSVSAWFNSAEPATH